MEEKLSVKTICQLTGINEHTLRAWERRYDVVRPRRLDNGRRVYSIEDLEKLKLIALLIRKGFLIGNIANYPLRQLSSILSDAAQTPDMDDRETRAKSRVEELAGRLEEAVANYELFRINFLLEQAKAEYGIREYIFNVILPLMNKVGEYVMNDRFSIGQEHGLSVVVKYHLMQVFFLLSNSHIILEHPHSPKSFAIATMEGNQHEFGTMVAAVLAAYHGYPVFYFGPNMPVEALASATESVGANSIILGLLPLSNYVQECSNYLERLDRVLPKVCEVWVGGSPPNDPVFLKERMQYLPSLQELDRLLANLKKADG